MVAGELPQRNQRREVAVHGKDAVGRDQRTRVAAALRDQQVLGMADVVVAVRHHGRAGEPRAVLDVHVAVGRALGERFPEVAVVGGTAPTIKAPGLGDNYYVVKEGVSIKSIADALDKDPELDRGTLQKRYETWLARVPPPSGTKGPGFPRTSPPSAAETVT